jgi:hypothetical protein
MVGTATEAATDGMTVGVVPGEAVTEGDVAQADVSTAVASMTTTVRG